MFGLGTPELVIIALGLVLLFGAKKIPDLMKGLGSGIKEGYLAASTAYDEYEKERERLKEREKQLEVPH